jgi:hypothetical protein
LKLTQGFSFEDVEIEGLPVSGSPLDMTIVPSDATNSVAILSRNIISAGENFQFIITSADKYKNLLDAVFYELYGPKSFDIQVQQPGSLQQANTSTAVLNKEGIVLKATLVLCSLTKST